MGTCHHSYSSSRRKNTFHLCASINREQQPAKERKTKNEVCWGGCFGARDDERVGVVVETSSSLSFSRSETKGTSDDGDGEERERERGRLRLAGRSNPNEIFTSLTERESRLLLHRRLADIESFNVHDSKTFSRGSRERYRSERTHEF